MGGQTGTWGTGRERVQQATSRVQLLSLFGRERSFSPPFCGVPEFCSRRGFPEPPAQPPEGWPDLCLPPVAATPPFHFLHLDGS